MSDAIGRIAVPTPVDSGLTFPLTSEFGYGYTQDFPVVVHRFGYLDAKAEQRYAVGIGPKKHAFRRTNLSLAARNQLFSFWEGLQGSWKTFLYDVPQADQTPVSTKVIWEYAPLSAQYLIHACQVGLHFIEVPDPTAAPSYSVSATVMRFPSTAMQSALGSDVQQIIPLIHIRVRESAVPDIYLSDRRCTVGGQLYLPRLINIGEKGSDVILSQTINGASDNAVFTFGNADRAMTKLANDTDLKFAQIDFSLYHINSSTLLNLWSGVILDFTRDGTPQFGIQAGDKLSQVTQLYPPRTISRTCWKTFNDGVNCPYATQSANHGGDPNTCDYYFDSSNGCQAHGMDDYFGGQPAAPQQVMILDNSTGLWGIGRNTVTATSIVSDTVFGRALPEVWCNSNGLPQFAYWLNAMIVAVRDEGDFLDSLSIVGLGPIGAFTPMTVATNNDGFRYLVSPMLDSQPPHGLRLDGNMDVTRYSTYGLGEWAGTDPQAEVFGMTAGGVPQGSAKCAGTSFIEIRIEKQKGITPSIPEQHQVLVTIDQGLTGWIWDASGNRTAVAGLINPFWIAINSYLRALGLQNADSATQLAQFVLSSVFVGDGSGTAEIADTVIPAGSALIQSTYEIAPDNKQFTFQGVIGSQKAFRDWLGEILSTALGYFTWEFGSLVLGGRFNATPVDAYDTSNMLFQSLKTPPIDAKFEHLTIEFSDCNYQYQTNTADYQDKDHAAYYGRSGSPLSSRMHSVGICNLEQAVRVAAIRTREEIGGVNAAEWRNACEPAWQTTLLGLTTGLGQVVSITHPEMPGLRGVCNVSGTACTWVSGDPLDSSMVGRAVLVNGIQVDVTAVTVGVTTTGNTTASGTSVSVTSAAGIAIGESISGTGIPAGTTVTAISGTTLTISQAATATGTGVTLTFGGDFTTDTAPGDGSNLSFQIIAGAVRVNSWKLKRDWSLELSGKTVTPSMYDLTVGPKPTDTAYVTRPPLRYALSTDVCWQPYQIQGAASDALYPNEYTFDLSAVYSTLTDGTAEAVITVTGRLPVNDFSPVLNAPGPVMGSVTLNATGGSIAGNTPLVIALAAVDSTGEFSYVSAIASLQIGTGSAFQVVLNNIVWPGIESGSSGSIAGWVLFASWTDDLMCAQASGSGTPASITFNGPLVRTSYAMPSSSIDKVRLKGKRELRSGVTVGKVTAIGTNTITVGDVDVNVPFVSGSYAGRILSAIGRQSGSIPFAHFNITGFSAGVFTVSQTIVGVNVGDIVAVRFQSSTSGATLTDSAGAFTGAEVGGIVRVIAGTGRGSLAKVTGSSATTLTLASSVTVDSTSVWIVEESSWSWSVDGTVFDNLIQTTQASWALPISNLSDQAVLLSGFTVDTTGAESSDGDQPVRECWMFGSSPTQTVTPSGAQNGTNTSFTLPSAPTNAASLKVFLNGEMQNPAIDYTVSGATITMIVPPNSDDWFYATYF